MSCEHRFLDQLNPNWDIEHLFIGTFNPSWNYNNAEQADYFYGRSRNYFWMLLPRIFGGENLKNETIGTKIEYLKNNNIGVTDIITSVINANENNEIDRNNLTVNFNDNVLNNYILEFNTNKIINLIDNNINSIRGVYLTRSTLNGINQIAHNWNEIVEYCHLNNIHSERLLTPARNFSERKVIDWNNKINI